MHCDACDVVGQDFDLARVQSGSNSYAEGSHALSDLKRGLDRATGAVEGGKNSVARCPDDDTAMPSDGPAARRIVLPKQGTPCGVADLCCTRSGSNDVCEEHRREHTGPDCAVGYRTRHETLDVMHYLSDFTREDQVICGIVVDDEVSAGNVFGEILPVLDGGHGVPCPVENECRYPHSRKDRPYVDHHVLPIHGPQRSGAETNAPTWQSAEQHPDCPVNSA